MNAGLQEIRRSTLPPDEYINSLEEPFRANFLDRKKTYRLSQDATDQIRKRKGDFVVVAFSAQWCKDCATSIPVLALISEATDLEVRIFGGLKKDPLSRTRKWRIPPSPPEVETFHVDKLPTIVVLDRNGSEIGRVVENPRMTPTLEQELWEIIKSRP